MKIFGRLLLLWLLFAFSLIARATEYYVDNLAGSDNGSGTSPIDAWRSLSKVNTVNFFPGDKVFFKRGQIWRGQLTISSVGHELNPIVFSAFGVGSNPVIKRTEIFESWELYYDKGGVKIWSGKLALGLGRSRGLVEAGSRRSSIYVMRGGAPEEKLENLTFGHGGEIFYYRKDEGRPIQTEIGAYNSSIFIENSQNIVIDSIDAEGPGASESSRNMFALVYSTSSSSNITIRNLTVSKSNTFGIDNGDGATDTELIFGGKNVNYENVISKENQSTGIYHKGTGKIVNCKSFKNGLLPNDSGDRGGIGIQGGPVLITGCEIHSIGRPDNAVDFGISVFEPSGTVTIERCYIHDLAAGGIQIHGNTRGGINHQIKNNIIGRFGQTTVESATSGKTAGIRLQNTEGVQILNNTISNGGSNWTSPGIFLRHSVENTSIINNIFYMNESPDISIYDSADTVSNGLISDNNLFYKKLYANNWNLKARRYSSLEKWQETEGQDTNSIIGDPLFKNTDLSEPLSFKLGAGSPAIDLGENVGLVGDYSGPFIPFGGKPDIGAWEYRVAEQNALPSNSPPSSPDLTAWEQK